MISFHQKLPLVPHTSNNKSQSRRILTYGNKLLFRHECSHMTKRYKIITFFRIIPKKIQKQKYLYLLKVLWLISDNFVSFSLNPLASQKKQIVILSHIFLFSHFFTVSSEFSYPEGISSGLRSQALYSGKVKPQELHQLRPLSGHHRNDP